MPPISAIPRITPINEMWWCPKLSALGSSSSKAMYTIMPATEARHIALTAGDQNGNRNAIPTSAPTGSASPDNMEYRKALRRSPVEW